MRMEIVTSAENKTGKRGNKRYILSLCVFVECWERVRENKMSGEMLGDV